MSLFIEVNSVENRCPVIINLDHVAEIAPLVKGGCAVFFSDSSGSGSKSTLTVTEGYELFKQLVMQMVTADDIAKKVERLKGTTKKIDPVV